MTYKQKAEALYKMILDGKMMDAFEQYYHKDVIMQELGEEPREGKEVNREYEKQFLAKVKEVHGAGVNSITSDEENGVVMIENWMDFTFHDGNRIKMWQVSAQKWDGDLIVSEVFYHK